MIEEIKYVDYTIKMDPRGIHFSDTDPGKLTMEQLERHGFSYGDKFVLSINKEGQIYLKKEGDEWVKMDGKWTRIMSELNTWSI